MGAVDRMMGLDPSRTDTVPLTRGAKAAMGVQSMMSSVTFALVLARSVNIFK